MRIAVLDYSGHPFQVQLSRELARRGHLMLHLYFSEFQTPKGNLRPLDDDPPTLKIEPVSIGRPFAKQSFVRRRFQEIEVGRKFSRRISEFNAEIVVASNIPLDPLQIVSDAAKAQQRTFIFWQQDIYSLAISKILRSKWGRCGALVGRWYKSIERKVLENSQAIIAISEDFVPYLENEFGITGGRVHVVENWAPINEITPQLKNNPWSRMNDLSEKEVVLYTGTLGMKHDPIQLLKLAQFVARRQNAEMVVISEGPAADWLMQKGAELGLPSLRVMKFQPFEDYSNVLATGDVLLSILEPDAGAFSVPSKILSYLSAGRPIVLSAPPENLASRVIAKSGAGKVVMTGDHRELATQVEFYLDRKRERTKAGLCARRYAERLFDIAAITDRFEGIFQCAVADRPSTSVQEADVAPSSAIGHPRNGQR